MQGDSKEGKDNRLHINLHVGGSWEVGFDCGQANPEETDKERKERLFYTNPEERTSELGPGNLSIGGQNTKAKNIVIAALQVDNRNQEAKKMDVACFESFGDDDEPEAEIESGVNIHEEEVSEDDKLWDRIVDFDIWTEQDKAWKTVRDTMSAEPIIKQEAQDIKRRFSHKQLANIVSYLQWNHNEIVAAFDGLCAGEEKYKELATAETDKALKYIHECQALTDKVRQLEKEKSDWQHLLNEQRKYNKRNDELICNIGVMVSHATTLTPQQQLDIKNREKELEEQIVGCHALIRTLKDRLFTLQEGTSKEIRERQIFALFMNEQISTEQLACLLGIDLVVDLNDWARRQLTEHHLFCEQKMHLIMEWKQLTNKDEVTAELTKEFFKLEGARLTSHQLNEQEARLIDAVRSNPQIADVYPLTLEEYGLITHKRAGGNFTFHGR